MNLVSPSGYCMPFEDRDPINVTHYYGRQTDGTFLPTVALESRDEQLLAVAEGQVTGLGGRPGDVSLTMQHGGFSVTYMGCGEVYAAFGSRLSPGDVVAKSGDRFEIGVKFDGEDCNPMDFLGMVYANMRMLDQQHRVTQPEFEQFKAQAPTRWDGSMPEIEKLMARHYMDYMKALVDGSYRTPGRTEAKIRNIFADARDRGMLMRKMPTIANPLGIDQTIMGRAVKILELLITDFLVYCELMLDIPAPPTDADPVKKKQSRKDGSKTTA